MKRTIGYLTSLRGRSARRSMVLISVIFWMTGFIRASMLDQNLMTAGHVLLVIQLLLVWPTFVAVPVRRFHDMNRSWWWVLIFLVGGLSAIPLLWMDLSHTGSLTNMSAGDILVDPQAFVDKIAALNADRLADDPIKPLGGAGMGGMSLAAIFLLIQFGWLHFIPGTNGPNRFGAQPHTPIH